MTIRDKNVLIGVTGGVAAYKALEVVRLLSVSGARVQTVMTRAATELVRPESFEALTGRRAAWDLWTSDREFRPAVAFGPVMKRVRLQVLKAPFQDLLEGTCEQIPGHGCPDGRPFSAEIIRPGQNDRGSSPCSRPLRSH